MRTPLVWTSSRYPSPRIWLTTGLLVAAGFANAADDPIALDPIEVTGSLIRRAEIERPSPVVVMTREEIELAGRQSFSEIMAELPWASATSISESLTEGPLRGASAINLRSFGAMNTLVLVDGRRPVNGGTSFGGASFVDLNRYPGAMVERVEILRDSGVLYGSGGPAGVVNVILRKDFTGAEISGSYGNSLRTNAAERSLSLLAGTSHDGSALLAGVSYFRRGSLLAADLPYTRNGDLSGRYAAKGPEYAARVASGYFDRRSQGGGPIAQVFLVTGQVNGVGGVSIPELAPSAAIRTIPGVPGFTATSVNFTSPARLGTGGQYNAAAAATFVPRILAARASPSNRYDRTPDMSLRPAVERTGFNLGHTRVFGAGVSGYARLSYQHNRTRVQYAQTALWSSAPSQSILPRTNYWNPFGIDVGVYYAPVDAGPRVVDTVDKTGTLVAGLRNANANRWNWDTAYSFGINRNLETFQHVFSRSRTRAALAKSTPDAYNVFGGAGFQNDPATIAGMLTWFSWPGEAMQHAWDAKVDGEAFQLPTGPVRAALRAELTAERSAERQDEEVRGDVMDVDSFNATTRRRLIHGLATELDVPLVKRGDRNLLPDAELVLAGRYDGYSDGFDSGFQPYAGLRLQPARWLTLRGSVARSFIAPALGQLKFNQLGGTQLTGYPDLRRPQALTGDPFDGAGGARTLRISGNSQLHPVQAASSQAGLVIDVPGGLFKGLTIGVSYLVLRQKDGIATPNFVTVQNNEIGGGMANLIIRQPGTETYTNRTNAPIPILSGPNGQTRLVAVGETVTVPGRIEYLVQGYINMRDMESRSWDVSLAYVRTFARMGRIQLRSSLAYLDYLGQGLNPAPTVNLAGGSPYPRVRIQSRASWSRGSWMVGITHNFIGHYGDLTRSPYVEVDPYSTIDAQLSWRFRGTEYGWLGNTRCAITLENIFDRQPPLDYTASGYRTTLINRPAGRGILVTLTKIR